MDAYEAILTRRSTRKYKADPVAPEILQKVVEAGRYAPSGGNNQTNHFLVVQSPDVAEKLVGLAEAAFAKMEADENTYPSLRNSILASKKGGYVFTYRAPVLIVVANGKDYGNNMLLYQSALLAERGAFPAGGAARTRPEGRRARLCLDGARLRRHRGRPSQPEAPGAERKRGHVPVMCGRYAADGETNDWLRTYCRCPSEEILRTGDVRPGERAPVVVAGSPKPIAVSMTWGIPGADSLIINARVETLWEKPTFRHLIEHRRCLLPASCFYEWDAGKHKVTLYGEESGPLFLAGIYQADPEGGRFVIITAPADETVKPIHDRMPVRIPKARIGEWLSDAERARAILDTAAVPLRREQDAEQLRLWE